MKCLTLSRVGQANGSILHDSHAEILALRAFNDFLLRECLVLATSPHAHSSVLRRRTAEEMEKSATVTDGAMQRPFMITEDVKLYMYCSDVPCGDASMELVMEAQGDATPWPITTPIASTGGDGGGGGGESGGKGGEGTLLGRGSFAELGVVRRKPARADSPPTLSKSCSDKIALKQCTSILSSLTSLLISPENAYIDTLILPSYRYRPEACARAFSATGRMAPLAGTPWDEGYAFRPFRVVTTEHDFAFSRRSANARASSGEGMGKVKGSNVSAVWTPYGQEVLINGILQGRRQGDLMGASMLSRRRSWKMVREIIFALSFDTGCPELKDAVGAMTYEELKASPLLEERRRVKAETIDRALTGWIRNEGDDFELGGG